MESWSSQKGRVTGVAGCAKGCQGICWGVGGPEARQGEGDASLKGLNAVC